MAGIDETRVRWIVDDAIKSWRAKARAATPMRGILMDPPSYGRGPGGEVWKLENELYALVAACEKVLAKDALFMLINSYTTGTAAGGAQQHAADGGCQGARRARDGGRNRAARDGGAACCRAARVGAGRRAHERSRSAQGYRQIGVMDFVRNRRELLTVNGLRWR